LVFVFSNFSVGGVKSVLD